MADRRPLAAIPAHFSERASAVHFRARVTAHKLVAAVYAAGGEPVVVARTAGRDMTASCYHHQCLDDVAEDLRVVARSEDGVVEAAILAEDDRAWFLGVQWHSEDTAVQDPAQLPSFRAWWTHGAPLPASRASLWAEQAGSLAALPGPRR